MREYDQILQRVANIESNLPGDDTITSHLARHCCLLGCASLEAGIKELLFEYTSKRSSKQTSRYVQQQLKKINNPKPEIIISTLGAFDHGWGERFAAFIDCNGGIVRESLASIVGHRNLIAHGRNSDVSFGRLRPWLKDVKGSLDFIEAELLALARLTQDQS